MYAPFATLRRDPTWAASCDATATAIASSRARSAFDDAMIPESHSAILVCSVCRFRMSPCGLFQTHVSVCYTPY